MRKKSRFRNLFVYAVSKVVFFLVLKTIVKQAVQEGRTGR